MVNYEITSIAGKYKNRKRVGRGNGSGHGKTAGRGSKGAGSRAGSVRKTLFEGGQMPLFRRLPKRGFNNVIFSTKFSVVNISQLDRFEDGAVVGIEELIGQGLVNNKRAKVKILGDGEISKKLDVTAHKFSKTAEQKITASGGKVKVV
jgi:large subunit ribosomal protein L15